MPASACDAIVNVLSAVHGSTDMGLATAYTHAYKIVRAGPIRGPGKTGPSCRPIIARDYVGTVKFLVGPPIAPDISASLILKGIDGDGDTITATIVTMLSDEYEENVDRDSPPGPGWVQAFLHKGDMATTPLTIS